MCDTQGRIYGEGQQGTVAPGGQFSEIPNAFYLIAITFLYNNNFYLFSLPLGDKFLNTAR